MSTSDNGEGQLSSDDGGPPRRRQTWWPSTGVPCPLSTVLVGVVVGQWGWVPHRHRMWCPPTGATGGGVPCLLSTAASSFSIRGRAVDSPLSLSTTRVR